MKMSGGYVNCPTLGWGDNVYRVKTEDTPQGHHNQGQRRRNAR